MNTETEEDNKVDQEPVSFVFSQPVDTSQLSEKDDGPPIESIDESKTVPSLTEDSHEVEEKEDVTEEDSSDESSDDGEVVEGLNFSWAVVPTIQNVSINQIISEESSQISFAAPLVEDEGGSVEDCDESNFDFPLPNDESINMEEDDKSEITGETEEVSAAPQVEKMSSDPEPSQEETDDTSNKAVKSVVEEQVTPSVTPSRDLTPIEDIQEREEEQTVPESSLRTPSQVNQEDHPLRRSNRKSVSSVDTTPQSVTPSRKSRKKTPSKRDPSPVEVDITTQLEVIEEENSRSSTDLRAEKSEVKLSETNLSRLTSETNPGETEGRVKASSKSRVSGTPATPIRRSRRLSGATPVLTPVLPTRGRRVSGAQSRTPAITAGETSQSPQTEDIQETSVEAEKPKSRGRRKESGSPAIALAEQIDTPDTSVSNRRGKAKTTSQGEQSPSTPKRASRSSQAVESPSTPKSATRASKASPSTPKRSSRSSKTEQSPSTPKRASRSSRTVDISLEEVESKPPATPERLTAIPKHLTPLKQATPSKESAKTPTRRTRRVSASESGSEQPVTPVRRSRRISGVSAEDLSSAPDGGLISGATPRRTPRSRRHNTSVSAEDVETALSNTLGSITPLPTLVEDVETEGSEDTAASADDKTPKRSRGRPRKSATAAATPTLDAISEEGASEVPSKSARPSAGKRKQVEEEAEVSTPPAKRRSRRVTITVLDSDVDLLGSPLAPAGERRKSASSLAAGNRKKYIPVKKKTSVRIK